MTPCAVLVIQNGHTRLVNIKNQDTITKILDMVPDMVDKFTGGKDSKLDENDVKDILDSVDVQQLSVMSGLCEAQNRVRYIIREGSIKNETGSGICAVWNSNRTCDRHAFAQYICNCSVCHTMPAGWI